MHPLIGIGVVSALLVGITGCGGGDSQQSQDPGVCPAKLLLDGVTYVQVDDRQRLRVDRPLADAHFTACGDADGEAVPAWKLEGVPAADAFAAEMGDSYVLYVVEGGDMCSVPHLRC